jgi:probable HAF family extracellular repeat protein
MKNLIASFALPFALLLVSGISRAQTPITCKFTFFSAPPSDPLERTNAADINRWGNVVGFTFITDLPFIRFADGRFETLPIFVSGFGEAIPARRNAFGVTVGSIIAPDGHTRGFVNHGTRTETFAFPGAVDTAFTGINRYGTIVGTFTKADGSIHSFKLKDGKTTIIAFRSNTQAKAISDTGVIVGTTIAKLPNQGVKGFVLANGVFKDFVFPGATGTNITAINASGMITGGFDSPTSFGSFIFKNGKFFVPQIPHPVPGLFLRSINGINGFGTIAGTADLADQEDPGSNDLGFVGKCPL